MVELAGITLLSFFVTFVFSIPFIRLLYRYNIRRIIKEDLDRVLKHRIELKFGTPVMGGAIIVFTIVLLSSVFLYDWEYYPLIFLVTLVGAIFGFIDEYINTLGRTLYFIRLSKSTNERVHSFFPTTGLLAKFKKPLLIPWKIFEEALRVMGSQQRGLKSHYKLLMYFVLVLIPIYVFQVNSHELYTVLPLLGPINVGYFYYVLLFVLVMFFVLGFGIADGMDGLSAGTHSIAFAALGLIAYQLQERDVAMLSFIIVGAELAFLYFNVFPARMEMSDVGTLPLGALFVAIAAMLHREIALPFVGFIFVIEFLSSIMQQWSVKLTGKRLFRMAPIHHTFEARGWHESKVVMRIWLFGALGGIAGLFVALL